MAEKQENVPANVFGGGDVAEQLKLTGKRISEARKALGISIREMAILHHITEEEYLRHENGEADIFLSASDCRTFRHGYKCVDFRRITPSEFLHSYEKSFRKES